MESSDVDEQGDGGHKEEVHVESETNYGEVGGLDYKGLVSYLRNKQVKASTKRGDIAAVMRRG